MDAKDVKKIFVVGAGTMGGGLSQAYAEAGYQVTLYSRTQKTLDKAIDLAKASLQTEAEEGLVNPEDIPEIIGRIKTTTSVEIGAKDADIAVETIVENAEEKRRYLSSWTNIYHSAP